MLLKQLSANHVILKASSLSLLFSLSVCLSLEQLEKCAQDLGSTSKAVGSSMAQLLTCAAQGNEHYTGEDKTHHVQTQQIERAQIRHYCGQNY